MAVRATVIVAGRRLRFYALHLGSPFGASPGQRRDQIDVVLRDARGQPGSGRDRGRLQLEGPGRAAGGGGLRVADAGHRHDHPRGFSFDHVFVKGLDTATMQAGVARDVTDASDHRPIWVV